MRSWPLGSSKWQGPFSDRLQCDRTLSSLLQHPVAQRVVSGGEPTKPSLRGPKYGMPDVVPQTPRLSPKPWMRSPLSQQHCKSSSTAQTGWNMLGYGRSSGTACHQHKCTAQDYRRMVIETVSSEQRRARDGTASCVYQSNNPKALSLYKHLF